MKPSFSKIGFVTMLIFGILCSFTPTNAFTNESPIPAAHAFIDKGAYALQINGEIRRSYNIDSPFIPASTIKILTGLMALETLGSQFRFSTYLYKDKANNLYVKGVGDPFLTSEAIIQIAQRLRKLEIKNLNSVVFDGSAFNIEGGTVHSAISDNPYDASSAAMAVNFNTISFIVSSNKKVVSGEKQTPYLPMMENLGLSYPEGHHRINVNSLPSTGQYSNTLRYCGELFTAIFRDQGIMIENGYSSGQIPQNIDHLIVYTSEKTVTDLVRLCLEYSTNFIANQLFLACGSKVFGQPASWKKARAAAQHYIFRHLALTPSEVFMVDGSGLSRQNRITAAAMLIVLQKFLPYAELLPEKRSIYVKSGTLTNVYSFAGYFSNHRGLSPFVIFLNQKTNTRDKILQLLTKEYSLVATSN